MARTQRARRRGKRAENARIRLSSASLRQALTNLEQALGQRESLQEVAQRLAQRARTARPGRRRYIMDRDALARTLTVNQPGGTVLTHYASGVLTAFKKFPPFAWPAAVYVPDAPGTVAPANHRYSLEWISPDPDSTPGIGPTLIQVRDASKTTGYIGVANAIPWWSIGASGWAQAGVGILFRPRYALSRITFVPDAQYRWEWVLDTRQITPTPRMINTGWLRQVAQRVNPISGAWEIYADRHLELWRVGAGNWGGPGPVFVNDYLGGSGTYPGSDPGLQVIASSADTLLLWLIVATYVQSDRGPTCMNKLEATVPLMSVQEDSLA
jgi:hypothetical protein